MTAWIVDVGGQQHRVDLLKPSYRDIFEGRHVLVDGTSVLLHTSFRFGFLGGIVVEWHFNPRITRVFTAADCGQPVL